MSFDLYYNIFEIKRKSKHSSATSCSVGIITYLKLRENQNLLNICYFLLLIITYLKLRENQNQVQIGDFVLSIITYLKLRENQNKLLLTKQKNKL